MQKGRTPGEFRHAAISTAFFTNFSAGSAKIAWAEPPELFRLAPSDVTMEP
jgi:hypothetical protein